MCRRGEEEKYWETRSLDRGANMRATQDVWAANGGGEVTTKSIVEWEAQDKGKGRRVNTQSQLDACTPSINKTCYVWEKSDENGGEEGLV